MASSSLIDDALAAAVAATSSLRFENAILLRSGRATVVRADASLNTGVRAHTIIKQFRPEYREHFLRERDGLRLLSKVSVERLVPSVLYENEAALTLILEDIREARSLESLFADSDPAAAVHALVAMARRLGIMHASARSLEPELSAPLPAISSPGHVLRRAFRRFFAFSLFAAHRLSWTLSWGMEPVFVADRDFVPGVGTRAMVRRYLQGYLTLAEPQESDGAPLVALARALAQRLSQIWPEAEPTFDLLRSSHQ